MCNLTSPGEWQKQGFKELYPLMEASDHTAEPPSKTFICACEGKSEEGRQRRREEKLGEK